MQFVKRKFTVLLICLFALVVSAFGLSIGFVNADTDEFVYSGTLDGSYTTGNTVNIPSAKVGDTDASVKIILPDGSFSNTLSLTLSQAGKYYIEYSVKKDGKILKESKSFIVKGNAFNLSGLSSQEYIVDEKYNLSGMKFELYPGSSVSFADIVDLTKLNGPTDTLFKLYHYVAAPGEAEISQFTVTLTDAYDENIKVVARLKRAPESTQEYTHTYADATFNDNGKFCSMTASDSGRYLVENLVGITDGKGNYIYTQHCSARIDDIKFGQPIMGSFTGGTATKPKFGARDWIGIAYDPDTNIIYLTCGNYRTILVDLENADVFGEAFGGFTDGKVKITITPTVFVKGGCNILITEFAGKKLTEDNVNNFVSAYQPEIHVDFGDYSESTVPSVKKGNTYTVFPAKGYDLIDGYVNVDTKVYYAYSNEKRVQINLTDGKFVANRLGTYTIVYRATNVSGIVTEKLINVQSVNDVNKLNVELQNEIDYLLEYPAGETITLFTGYEFVNEYGNCALSVTATLKTDPSVSFELNEKNNYSFMPVISGEYDIVFNIADYSETAVVEKSVKVVGSSNLYYELNGFFPDYFIVRGDYDLNIVKAFSLNTGIPVEENVIYGVDVNGSYEWLGNKDFTAKEEYVNSNGAIKVVYKPNKNNISVEKYFVREIPVIDTGLYTFGQTARLDMTKYFVSTVGSFTAVANAKNICYKVDSLDNGRGVMDFINVLNANPFKIEFAPIIEDGVSYVPFNKVSVYLINPLNKEQFVKITMEEHSSGWYFTLNDARSLKFANSWGDADDYFYINFNEASANLTANIYYAFTDVCFYGTNEIVSFPKGVNLRVEVEGDDNATGILVKSVCSALMTNRKTDIVPAAIDHAHDTNAGEKEINEIITLNPFFAYDVFAPYLKTKLTVTLIKDGQNSVYVKSLDGMDLLSADATATYQFKLSEYGTYKVSISATDGINVNNDVLYSYSIIVVDKVKPVVTIKNYQTTAKVGDELKVPEFTVNADGYNWYMTVRGPDGRMAFVNSDTVSEETYKFAQSGVHYVSFIVYDSNIKTGEVTYTVTIK